MAYYDYTYDTDPYDYGVTPLPPPDKNWVDPASVVRKYLSGIQRGCLQEQFKDLNETGLYLLEVLVDSLELSKNILSLPVEGKQIRIKVKIPTLEFLDVDEEIYLDNEQKSISKSGGSFKGLFENIFTSARYKLSQVSEPDSLVHLWDGETQDSLGDGQTQSLGNGQAQDSLVNGQTQDITTPGLKEPDAEVTSAEKSIDAITFNINRGKAALLVMSGLEMVKSLQQHPVTVHVTVMEGEDTGEVLLECDTVLRIPESFRQAVLKSSMSEAVLPITSVTSDACPLWAEDGFEVGAAHLTVLITCLGQAVINSLREDGTESYNYENTLCLNTLKMNHNDSVDSSTLSPLPGPWKVNLKTSDEILRACKLTNINSFDLKSRECSLNKCCWFKMAQELIPKTEEVDSIQMEEDPQVIMDTLWRENRTFCEQFLEDERSHIQEHIKEEDTTSSTGLSD